ncbi:hypothetical protein [Nocardia takedensis]|uniref:hypothetical protein n=1 Tax=Nocardia takedensis TaxID=259390 RepID=UPI00031CDC46|nr:hypothetical protein [Nocardia takedensis]
MKNTIIGRLVRTALGALTLAGFGLAAAAAPALAQQPWDTYIAEVIDTTASSPLPIAWCPQTRPACELTGQRTVGWFQTCGLTVEWDSLDAALEHRYEPRVTVAYDCAPDPTTPPDHRVMVYATGVLVHIEGGLSGKDLGEAFIPDGGSACHLV